jgi:glutaredoxin-related protein
MDNLGIISERINALRSLSDKNLIHFDDLRQEFRQDLQSFIVGETLSVRDGKVVIGNNLYKRWLEKIRTKGFDYEIDFK